MATHRIHHQYSDKPGDPHSPREGAWWSHIGWLLTGESKHNNTKLMAKYAPDLAKDPFYVTLNTYHWVPIVAVSVLLFVFGGLPLVLWATCLRLTFGLHATWAVNSVTHMWGSRRFSTRDDSRNNVWSRCSPSAKAGTTTTMRIPLRPGTAWRGTRSISPGFRFRS